jgi:hypothetical protein
LYQGCPLSPTLYIIMVDSLSKIWIRREKILLVISFPRGIRETNNSQFIDDTLLFGEASVTLVKRYNVVLDKYFKALGGKINNMEMYL